MNSIILIIFAYIILVIIFVNIVVSVVHVLANQKKNMNNKEIIKRFFYDLVFGWFRVLDILFWFI